MSIAFHDTFMLMFWNYDIIVVLTDHDLEEGHEVGVAGAAAVDREVSQKVAPGK